MDLSHVSSRSWRLRSVLRAWPLARPAPGADRAADGPLAKFADRDKTGTTAAPKNSIGSQAVATQPLTSRVSLEAEGMGFEPTTPFGAPDFESGRWPIRLPSEASTLI